MASSLVNKLVASLASAQNEVSLAAANLNLDFTLIRLEAPKEFRGVDNSLSDVRRDNAERGSLHRTARKLGALFDGVPPPAEHLLSAYGKRVSEICERKHIDPKERARHGIFSQFVGPDSASLWAAATSGTNAIAIHLLASMIAGVFDSAESIALWLQLIEKRKAEIESTIDKERDAVKAMATALATQQEFTRDELAAWDNSARSWINTGHAAMAEQRKVALLYSDEAGMPVNSSTDPYESVIAAWRDAMSSMDSLIQGIPQRVRNGAVLLAINSWHLYPDLCILSRGPDVIHQKDPLVLGSGILTVDVERPSETGGSVVWSLPLAYLRYYGEPVVVNRTLSVDSTRISMDQFRYVLLGCVFATWTGFGGSVLDDINLMARLLDTLRSPERSTQDSTKRRAQLYRMKRITSQNSWIGQLLMAADDIISGDDVERETAIKLVNHGRRHAKFLCKPEDCPPPFFGLSYIPSLFALLNSPEAWIGYLRQLATDRGLSGDNYVIRYYLRYGSLDYEYATIKPVSGESEVSNQFGFIRRPKPPTTQREARHMRWIPITTKQPSCDCVEACSMGGPAPSRGEREKTSHFMRLGQQKKGPDTICSCRAHGGCSVTCHWDLTKECLSGESSLIKDRMSYIHGRGEICLPVHDMDIKSYPASVRADFGNGTDFQAALMQLGSGQNGRDIFVNLEPYAGDYDKAAIFITGPTHSQRPRLERTHNPDYLITGETFQKAFQPDQLNHDLLTEWFLTKLLAKNPGFVQPLRACAAAGEMYSRLPEATVDSSIVARTSLTDARWFSRADMGKDFPLSRPEAFACIAMFDSGRIYDTGYLQNVFAMTYGNSIFVASPMMADPYETPVETEIKRVPGNIGQPGLSFLIPPPEPRIRKSNPEAWTVLSHKPFEGQLEDNFWKTSMHLTLTQYQPGLRGLYHDEHFIDEGSALRETLVQVYDSSEWVCDLDILSALSNPLVSRVRCSDQDQHTAPQTIPDTFPQTATVDNWEELLTPPLDAGFSVVRTSGNWLGRLAAVGVSIRLRRRAVILPKQPCWSCVETHLRGLKPSRDDNFDADALDPVLIL
ncbi:uncharacterized protein NECHADRAFT_80807 [Fusarium vanettenii 77-13-4]|uniref:Uncharacterized protein n=1 Tax=Fusarium vanettenii (strain ATCC MYA-4622 / CBS 123669 / FGSC 9596 / NRRL 45880 / 77-13-4) TaxID=660122 RepID=C7YSP5_FUSV7|nr:uncharacterized protein NECHADRAFT_80807 [Fusarium vanettenii 77-13-4]EEU45279.1 hypothetical protein NECHADRAFT_80807 [Fusarium vanettenii 77-13-4]